MKNFFMILLLGLVLASLGANAWLWFDHSQLKLETESLSNQIVLQKEPTEVGEEASGETQLGDQDKLEKLTQDLEELEAKVTQLESGTKTTTTVSAPVSTTVVESSKVKEHYVYLGTGSTTSREWQDIDSTITVIDSNNYSNVKSVNFEAAMSILGGEVHARLANKDTGAIFHDSEISHNTSSSNWKISSPISLYYGSVRYVVQLKSTSGERANLDGARIKILVE